MRRLKGWQGWLVALLLLANGAAWLGASSRTTLPEVEPILHPELAEIRNKWQSGEAVGERFAVTVTDQMASETIAWFLDFRGNLPISHPQVEIHPGWSRGGALVNVAGMRAPALGRIDIWLGDGKPDGRVTEITFAGATAPPFVIAAVDQARAFYDDLNFPVEITVLDLREGEVYIEGHYTERSP